MTQNTFFGWFNFTLFHKIILIFTNIPIVFKWSLLLWSLGSRVLISNFLYVTWLHFSSLFTILILRSRLIYYLFLILTHHHIYHNWLLLLLNDLIALPNTKIVLNMKSLAIHLMMVVLYRLFFWWLNKVWFYHLLRNYNAFVLLVCILSTIFFVE